MEMQSQELQRVMKKQVELYDEMARSVWGDRMLLGLTASALGGMGIGLLFNRSWGTRMTGAVLYATAGMMELYAIMAPKKRGGREPTEVGVEPDQSARAA